MFFAEAQDTGKQFAVARQTECGARSDCVLVTSSGRARGTTQRGSTRVTLQFAYVEVLNFLLFSLFFDGDQAVGIIAHDAVDAGGHEHAHVGGMIDRPAYDL